MAFSSPNLLVHGVKTQSNKPLAKMWAVHRKIGVKFEALGNLSHCLFVYFVCGGGVFVFTSVVYCGFHCHYVAGLELLREYEA